MLLTDLGKKVDKQIFRSESVEALNRIPTAKGKTFHQRIATFEAYMKFERITEGSTYFPNSGLGKCNVNVFDLVI